VDVWDILGAGSIWYGMVWYGNIIIFIAKVLKNYTQKQRCKGSQILL
jgi:hypothetical protein